MRCFTNKQFTKLPSNLTTGSNKPAQAVPSAPLTDRQNTSAPCLPLALLSKGMWWIIWRPSFPEFLAWQSWPRYAGGPTVCFVTRKEGAGVPGPGWGPSPQPSRPCTGCRSWWSLTPDELHGVCELPEPAFLEPSFCGPEQPFCKKNVHGSHLTSSKEGLRQLARKGLASG